MKKFRAVSLLLMAPVLAPMTASAAEATSTLAVSATVLEACVVTPATMLFGNYTGSENDATATITVTCTVGTGYQIGLDEGGAGDTVTTRAMSDGGTGSLPYALYSDAGRTQNWGETLGVDTVDEAAATGLPENHTVYGRIAADVTSAPAGVYTDTVNITVTY